MRTLVLDATVVIAITFFGTTIAGTIMPWRDQGCLRRLADRQVQGADLAGLDRNRALRGGRDLPDLPLVHRTPGRSSAGIGTLNPDGLTWFVVILLGILTVVNAVILLWILYYVGRRILGGAAMPLITLAGLIFLGFLDWLLVEWFWDPHVLPASLPAVGTYAIGWSNVSSMVFMLFMYVLAAVIYFGFSSYRRRQGIDVDKIYKEIPVE